MYYLKILKNKAWGGNQCLVGKWRYWRYNSFDDTVSVNIVARPLRSMISDGQMNELKTQTLRMVVFILVHVDSLGGQCVQVQIPGISLNAPSKRKPISEITTME